MENRTIEPIKAQVRAVNIFNLYSITLTNLNSHTTWLGFWVWRRHSLGFDSVQLSCKSKLARVGRQWIWWRSRWISSSTEPTTDREHSGTSWRLALPENRRRSEAVAFSANHSRLNRHSCEKCSNAESPRKACNKPGAQRPQIQSFEADRKRNFFSANCLRSPGIVKSNAFIVSWFGTDSARSYGC